MSKKKKKTIKSKDTLFSNITTKQKDDAVELIIEASCPRKSFFLMTTLSAVICTLGIITNNAAIIIGAMLVAPMLSSILAISLGVGMGDFKLIYRSIEVVIKAVFLAVGFSFLISLMLDKPSEFNHEMLLRVGVNTETLIIALAAGVAASLSIIRQELHQYLAGTVIAVALIPPLSMSAIALRMFEFDVFYNSLMVFLFNLIGIVLSSLLVFSLTKFYT
ncbi:MAG: TIGR00341 family protein [Patescibacteria group bacterium]|jgi:uncharacterized hydrophobic protein (TIGR00271 family)|nr:TIGR00341 family protein [Patescibacteria group bacterium]